MPRSGLLPTPVSSTDIRGKDDSRVPSGQMSFTLPPPAIASAESNTSSNASIKSDSSYHPASPTSPAIHMPSQKRRMSSSQRLNSAAGSVDFTLPPPPTRSRKIIQMKPGPGSEVSSSSATSKGKKGGPATTTGNGKKQPTSTSVAGRKTARKTAHSLIERRRRSKMNEEFGVLKDMIPACQNQEMHKLAILQASIDYLRYLEQCITDLKAANGNFSTAAAEIHSQAPTPRPDISTRDDGDEEEDDEEADQEMEDEVNTSPAPEPIQSTHSVFSSHSSTASPAILPAPNQRAHASSYSSTNSSLPSPAFLPQLYQPNFALGHNGSEPILYRPAYSHSTETSPAILPQGMGEADHEATAALLLLNADRRGHTGKGSGKAMSVKDLLSA